ncbi:hypothetical protein QR680_003028 [Steinernema hermaphroditum]|uniref:CWH43-like N-terminal domain-containing protein n=1 Tax=Steinernema hermaphroditum TaxID=289476 RepID=A0AA39H617_9BILA|nr:hypothetical protein QR680_003028 [Steinernema hermaphroditum]
MVLVNVWIFPLLTTLFIILTVVSCYVIGLLHGLHPTDWGAISDITNLPYQQTFYAELTNITAILVCVCVYMRHRLIIAYFTYSHIQGTSFFKHASVATTWIGMLGAFALSVSSNFPESEFPCIHSISVWVMFSLCIAYIWSQTVFTFFTRAPFISIRFIFLFRLAISLVATACFASGRTISIKSEQTDNDIMIRTILRWSVYALFCIYMTSEAYELWFTEVKALKLVIPGGVLYDETVLRPRLRAATFASLTEYGEDEEEDLLAATLVP